MDNIKFERYYAIWAASFKTSLWLFLLLMILNLFSNKFYFAEDAFIIENHLLFYTFSFMFFYFLVHIPLLLILVKLENKHI